MLHPVMIAIVTANTSITILYWAFILTEVFSKKINTEAKAKDNHPELRNTPGRARDPGREGVQPHSVNMLHPIMIGIVTANTSITIIFWNFILSQVFLSFLGFTQPRPGSYSGTLGVKGPPRRHGNFANSETEPPRRAELPPGMRNPQDDGQRRSSEA